MTNLIITPQTGEPTTSSLAHKKIRQNSGGNSMRPEQSIYHMAVRFVSHHSRRYDWGRVSQWMAIVDRYEGRAYP
jgi:hypothetical protein